jgi:tetraacyldisaccharide 4'-kinase
VAGPAATPSPRGGLDRALQEAWDGRGLASTLLLPLAWVFGTVAATRRQLYRSHALSTRRLPVPVVVVGNLLAGGAGKTPTVIAVAALLRSRGYAPGIVSRGYGRRDDRVRIVGRESSSAEVGDEPLLLRRRTGVPVAVGADRAAAADALLRAHPDIDVLVGDDGLQHLRLERDAEVLVFDERGAGNGRLLPAGPLREPVPRRLRPRQVVLYNADRPSTPLPGHTARRSLAGVVRLERWWAGERPSPDALDALRDRNVWAAAGMARPQRFFAMLREHGLSVTELALADHHDFRVLPWPAEATDVVVTEKDAVKLTGLPPSQTRIWVAALDFRPDPGFDAALLALLPGPRAKPSAADPSTSSPHGHPPP